MQTPTQLAIEENVTNGLGFIDRGEYDANLMWGKTEFGHLDRNSRLGAHIHLGVMDMRTASSRTEYTRL